MPESIPPRDLGPWTDHVQSWAGAVPCKPAQRTTAEASSILRCSAKIIASFSRQQGDRLLEDFLVLRVGDGLLTRDQTALDQILQALIERLHAVLGTGLDR